MSYVKTNRGAGESPLPLDRAPQGEVTRRGDLIAQEIFALISTETTQSGPSRRTWAALERDLHAPDSQRRTAASKLLTQIAHGTELQTQRRAKNACCLILYTLAGLTLEQIALAFGHDKGHIVRLVENAAEDYRKQIEARDSLDQRSGPTLSQLSTQRPLDRADRDRLKKKAKRFADAIFREPASEREFILTCLLGLLGRD